MLGNLSIFVLTSIFGLHFEFCNLRASDYINSLENKCLKGKETFGTALRFKMGKLALILANLHTFPSLSTTLIHLILIILPK